MTPKAVEIRVVRNTPEHYDIEELVRIYGEHARDPEKAKWFLAHERAIKEYTQAFRDLAK